MSIVISTKEIPGGIQFGGLFIKGDCYKLKNDLVVIKGDICEFEDEELFNQIIQNGITKVSELSGTFFIITFNKVTRKLWVANDRIGYETLFYFFDKNIFILSDDFWEIVNLIEPDFSYIDIQSVKELIIFLYPLFNKTIITNLNFFPAASIGEFSLEKKIFTINQYWDFKYNVDHKLTIDEAIERINRALNIAFEKIKEHNPPDTIYGVGLSGGLDSRLIPIYALKHGMRLKSFIIGEKRPRKLFLSWDHKNARKLAKHFNLEHHEIEYDSESFEEKIFRDTRYFPMGTSELFRTVQNCIPDFDVLLTGSTHTTMISWLPNNINQLSKEELLNVIINYLSKKNPRYTNKINKFLKLMFKRPRTTEQKQGSIENIISNDEMKVSINEISHFISDNQEKSNNEILLKYSINHIGRKSKYGAFESLQGWKKTYSFYYPYLLNEILSWKISYLKDRRILKEFLSRKFPALAKINIHGPSVPIFYQLKRPGFLRNLYNLIVFIIRGKGITRYKYWAWKKKCRKFTKNILFKENSMFSKIFNAKEIQKLKKEYAHIYEMIIKIKYIFDILESKGYQQFFQDKN